MVQQILYQSPELRQEQIIAPHQIQSLEMLTAPLLEIQVLINQELEVNPTLERLASNGEQLQQCGRRGLFGRLRRLQRLNDRPVRAQFRRRRLRYQHYRHLDLNTLHLSVKKFCNLFRSLSSSVYLSKKIYK